MPTQAYPNQCLGNVFNALLMCGGAALRLEEARSKALEALQAAQQAGVPDGNKRCIRRVMPKDGRRCDVEWKPLAQFHSDPTQADGCKAVCKNCLAWDREVQPWPCTVYVHMCMSCC